MICLFVCLFVNNNNDVILFPLSHVNSGIVHSVDHNKLDSVLPTLQPSRMGNCVGGAGSSVQFGGSGLHIKSLLEGNASITTTSN